MATDISKTDGQKILEFVETDKELKCVFLTRMDTLTCSKIEKEYTDRITAASGKRIVFDIAKVDYVASSFLRLCIIATKDAAKNSVGKLMITNCAPSIRKVIKISGFENVADIS